MKNLIESFYETLCNTPSDINEHLPVLKKLSEKCDKITEMGVRGIVSTFAFVSANPKKIVCVDLFHPSKWDNENRLQLIETYCKNNNIDFSFIFGDSLQVDIPETDLLFIDTLHTYYQLKNELNKHYKNVNKYIVLHDTVLYGTNDEENTYTNDIRHDNKKTGLNLAVNEFLKDNPEWEVLEIKTNNNGLTILKRKYDNENL